MLWTILRITKHRSHFRGLAKDKRGAFQLRIITNLQFSTATRFDGGPKSWFPNGATMSATPANTRNTQSVIPHNNAKMTRKTIDEYVALFVKAKREGKSIPTYNLAIAVSAIVKLKPLEPAVFNRNKVPSYLHI